MIVLQNGTLVDRRGTHHHDIGIKGSEIVPPEKSDENSRIEIDIANQFVAPGLIDMHVHLLMDARPTRNVQYLNSAPQHELIDNAVRNLQTAIRTGVTTIRDLGGRGSLTIDTRVVVDSQLVEGPAVEACGEAIGIVDGDSDYMCRTIDGSNAARTAVNEQAERGADVIKCMASGGNLFGTENRGPPELSTEVLAAIVDAAANHGLHVAAHAHGDESIRNAVDAGVDSIEHGTLMSQRTANRMASEDIVWVPTRKAIVSFAEAEPTKDLSPEVIQRAGEVDQEFKQTFNYALEAGVTVAMGTDAGTAGNQFADIPRELELMVEYGMSPEQAFYAATSNAADLLDQPDLASLRVGTRADLLVLPRNPLEDVLAWQRPEYVITGGTLIQIGS